MRNVIIRVQCGHSTLLISSPAGWAAGDVRKQ